MLIINLFNDRKSRPCTQEAGALLRRIRQGALALILLACPLLAMAIVPKKSATLDNTVGEAKAGRNYAVLDRVIATVNNDAISESELNQQMHLLLLRLKQTEHNLPPEDVLRKQLLEKIVLEKLQLQIAKQDKLEVDDATVDETVKQIASHDNMSVQDLQQFLEEQNVPFKYFRESIKNEMTISKLQQKEVGQFITISASELDHFLHSPLGQDQSGAEYKLGHILLALPENPSQKEVQKIESQAKDIIKQLKNGGNFEKFAMANSSGPQALNGGDLGFRKSSELPTLFAKVVPTLPVGEVHGPIKNASGIHIIKLLDKRIAGASTLQQPRLEVKARHILIKPSAKRSDKEAEALLNQIRSELKSGQSFASLAQKNSEEARSREKGGELGWISQENADPAFYREAANLNPGEVSKPFKTSFGWHIVAVTERRTRAPSQDAIKNRAMDALYQRKFEEQLSVWLRRLRDEAHVETYLKNDG